MKCRNCGYAGKPKIKMFATLCGKCRTTLLPYRVTDVVAAKWEKVDEEIDSVAKQGLELINKGLSNE